MRRSLSTSACLMVMATASFGQNPFTKPPKPPPKRGMTKAEVTALYGEPRHRGNLDGVEVWYYRVKFNEVYGRAFVPFEFSSDNVNLGEIFFDRRGRISRYVWTHARID